MGGSGTESGADGERGQEDLGFWPGRWDGRGWLMELGAGGGLRRAVEDVKVGSAVLECLPHLRAQGYHSTLSGEAEKWGV